MRTSMISYCSYQSYGTSQCCSASAFKMQVAGDRAQFNFPRMEHLLSCCKGCQAI